MRRIRPDRITSGEPTPAFPSTLPSGFSGYASPVFDHPPPRPRSDWSEERGVVLRIVEQRLEPRVPCIPAAQFALVEPHLDAMAAQGFGNPPGRLGVLARVAGENGGSTAGWCAGVVHGVIGPRQLRRPLTLRECQLPRRQPGLGRNASMETSHLSPIVFGVPNIAVLRDLMRGSAAGVANSNPQGLRELQQGISAGCCFRPSAGMSRRKGPGEIYASASLQQHLNGGPHEAATPAASIRTYRRGLNDRRVRVASLARLAGPTVAHGFDAARILLSFGVDLQRHRGVRASGVTRVLASG